MTGQGNMMVDAPLIGRRYRLEQTLGRGAMGTVYRAVDRLNGQTVALKRVIATLDSMPDHHSDMSTVSFRVMLANEFQTLASLRHPHIISVLDYGFDSEKHPYFTMSLVQHPQTVTEYGMGRSTDIKITLLIEILQALDYLHRHGIVHRDLKPDNALVTAEEGVKVLDFGLAMLHEQIEESDLVAGTLAYMAPELLLGEQATQRSDLYAVGIIGYELFAGHHPFPAEHAGQLVQNILYSPADLDELDVEPEIAFVIGRLIDKAPEMRYSSASEVIAALCEASRRPLPYETLELRDSYLQAAKFVGRAKEMNQLTHALQTTLGGKGSLWMVGGESGVGKSRLLDELRTRALVQGMLVLRGQAVSGGGLPYQLWREPLRRLILVSNVDPLDASILKEIVADAEILLEKPLSPIMPLEGAAHQQRLFGAINSLFQLQQQPILLVLEDLQWTSESLDVLKQLANIVHDLPVMIVGSYRIEERPTLPDELPGANVLRLERLEPFAIAELSESMLGVAGRQRDIVDLLTTQTRGNVFFMIEVVRALADSVGRLTEIGMLPIPQQLTVGGIRNVIARRLNFVPVEARPLLNIAAAAGRTLDLKLLQLISNQDLEDWLAVCANSMVLEVQDGNWHFPYDELRYLLLSDLETSQQSLVYRTVAEAVEQVYPNSPEHAFILTQHWSQAGDQSKEQHYAKLAGEYALRISALQEAITYLSRALALLEAQSAGLNEAEAYLHIKLGEAFKYAGDYTAAYQHYEAGLRIGDNLDALALLGMSDVLSLQGDAAQALSTVERSLTLYQEKNDTAGIIRALNQRGRLFARRGDYDLAAESSKEALALSRSTEDVDGIADAINNLGTLAFSQGKIDEARDYFEETLTLCRGSGERRKIGITLMNLGGVAGMVGDFEGATRYFEEALNIARLIGERRIELMSIDNLGYLANLQEDHGRAVYYLEQSLSIARSISNQPGIVTALVNLGHVARKLQRREEAMERYRAGFELAVQTEAHPNALEALVGLADITDNLEEAVRWLGLVLSHSATPEETRKEAETTLDEIRVNSGLTTDRIEDHLSTGRRLRLEEITFP
jgi:tetratricopeptide (TPR) repeat protein